MTRITSFVMGAALVAIGASVVTTASAQEMIRRSCDFDNLGLIGAEERFQRIDTNNSGYIDRRELMTCMWPADFTGREHHRWGEVVSLAEQTINKYDENEDGLIGKSE